MTPELFSEVYSCYYQVVRRILEEAGGRPVSEREMNRLADQYGYEETAMTIVPKLVSGEWELLEPVDSGYVSKVSPPKPLPLTKLQKAWLKALLKDPRIRLFFRDKELHDLETALSPVSPLYYQEDFIYFDRYADGDPFESLLYREHFAATLKAVRENHLAEIDHYSAKGNHSCRTYIPCRLEYSEKEDKFRLLAILMKKDGHPGPLFYLKLSRILKIRDTQKTAAIRPDIDQYLKASLCPEPVVLEISTERNALERTMLHFACYEKRTVKMPDTEKYRCQIYYKKSDETELLIQVLSFGPVVKVLGPEAFLAQVKERVERQKTLLAERRVVMNLPIS